MNLNRKFLFEYFKYATLLLCVIQVSSKPNSCDLKVVDKCVEQLVSFRIGGVVPSNMNESRLLCNAYGTSLGCIVDYANGCVDGLVKQLMKLGLDSIKKVIGQKCTEEEMQAYHKVHSKCIKEHIGGLENCFITSLLKGEMIIGESPEKHIPFSCCLVSQAEHCVLQTIRECNPLTITYITDLFSALTTDLKELLCGSDYEYNSPNCIALNIKEPEKGKKPQFQSVLPTILKAAESFQG